jgi:hypothetical protein
LGKGKRPYEAATKLIVRQAFAGREMVDELVCALTDWNQFELELAALGRFAVISLFGASNRFLSKS